MTLVFSWGVILEIIKGSIVKSLGKINLLLASGTISEINLCCKISTKFNLPSGLTFNIFDIKFLPNKFILLGQLILKLIILSSIEWVSFLKGGSPDNNSNIKTPIAQISTLVSYPLFKSISGDWYILVPTVVNLALFWK